MKETDFVIVVVGHLSGHVLPHQKAGLISPCSGDVAHGVATPTENENREIEAFDEIDAVGVAPHAEVEAAKAIAG